MFPAEWEREVWPQLWQEGGLWPPTTHINDSKIVFVFVSNTMYYYSLESSKTRETIHTFQSPAVCRHTCRHLV